MQTGQSRRSVYEHEDGRVCRWLAYSLDHDSLQPSGILLHAWFYGLPPDMRRCQRDHHTTGDRELT